MADLDAFLQNVEDISGQTTSTITSLVALITALIAFGEKAYPYAVKVIEAVIELYSELGSGYESIVELLENV